ncbi:MAG: hypothetical protein JWP25_7834 [Bradyrhizobium sp.]|nr:hypothetical protein [Bradyrhizobium sp.]
MPNELDPAIAAFERRREDALASVAECERTINTLCKEAGYPPRYAETTTNNSMKVTQISDDTFYGQKQTPAMRMYLEMRKAQGLGPATPRDIYQALEQGGYVFEAKNSEIAMVGMRALLRTQPNVFHRLPQGTWGLTTWYPDAKKPKEEPKPKKKKAAARKSGAVKKVRTSAQPKPRVRVEEPGESQTPVDE